MRDGDIEISCPGAFNAQWEKLDKNWGVRLVTSLEYNRPSRWKTLMPGAFSTDLTQGMTVLGSHALSPVADGWSPSLPCPSPPSAFLVAGIDSAVVSTWVVLAPSILQVFQVLLDTESLHSHSCLSSLLKQDGLQFLLWSKWGLL